jgi:hypothetical protein
MARSLSRCAKPEHQAGFVAVGTAAGLFRPLESNDRSIFCREEIPYDCPL